MNTQNKAVLLDVELLIYRFSYRHGKTNNIKKAQTDLDLMIQNILKDLNTSSVMLCISDSSNNFRKSILKCYKHSRNKSTKPQLLSEIKDYAKSKYYNTIINTLEADDIIGICATYKPDDYIIATFDKDMKQIPGLHYDWQTKQFEVIEKLDADLFHAQQTLTGDTTDGYYGCPGIGPKYAQDIIKELRAKVRADYGSGAEADEELLKQVWLAIRNEYLFKDLSEEYMLKQARCARILRCEDYDFKAKQVKLWIPPYE